MKQESLQKSEKPAAEMEKKSDRACQTAVIEKLCAASFGLKDGKVALQILTQATNFQSGNCSELDLDKFNRALSTLSEIGPKGALEVMLALQMIGVHQAALQFLSSATVGEQTAEGRDLNLLRATRLMHLFLEQIEAMQKLKGKAGQQRVTVEHVHVHEGGRAIVGAVSVGERAVEEGSDGPSPAKKA